MGANVNGGEGLVKGRLQLGGRSHNSRRDAGATVSSLQIRIGITI